jgi:uncharacterized protein HemX
MPPMSASLVLLLLLAALLGGAVAAWWVRRSAQQASAEQARQQVEWDTWRLQIERRLAERREPDLTPLVQRLAALEKAVGSIRLPTPEPTNLRPVLDAIASIRLPAAPAVNLEPLHNRLLGLEDAIRIMGTPTAAPAPAAREADLAGVVARLGAIEQHLARLRPLA